MAEGKQAYATTQADQSPAGMRYGSDLATQVLRDLGIKYIALNPGASYRWLHDSIVNYGESVGPDGDPEMILCTHEGIAVAVAHGYTKATGEIMAVGLHNVVGLQHASMAIFNAWCDQAAMLLIGGTGPINVEHRRPGIDWVHTALVQGNLVRDFVKWDDQPSSHAGVIESLARGVRIAITDPPGPVYICYDGGLSAEVLGEDAPLIPDVTKLATPSSPPAADPVALEKIAAALRTAKWPVLVAGRVGRSEVGFRALSELAERWAIPVIDQGDRLNLPTTHPMNLSPASREVIKRADVIVALDLKSLLSAVAQIDHSELDTPWLILDDDAKVFSISLEEYLVTGFSADYQALFPTEQSILADTSLALPALLELLGSPGDATTQRRAEVAEWHATLRRNAINQANEQRSERPIKLSVLYDALANLLDREDYVIANASSGWLGRRIDLDEPRQALGGSGGGGLGYGIGFTIGTCLAYRGTDKVVVDVQSDGGLMMTPGGLWSFAHHDLAALIVMNNNRSYYNSEDHGMMIAKERDRDEKRAGIGTAIDPPAINFAKLAESMGVEGIGPIDDPSLLAGALVRALAIVKNDHRTVLVDVVTSPI